MTIVLANAKKSTLLEKERVYLNTLRIKLFVNNFTPVEASVVSAFTECTDGGYSGVTNVGFLLATLNASNQGETVAPAITWTFNFSGGAFTVYGYYFIDPADGVLVWSERAPVPFTVSGSGQTYTVTPKKIQTTF